MWLERFRSLWSIERPPADSREATSNKMTYYSALRLFSSVLEVPVRLLGAKRFLLIKERFRLAENLQSARYLPSVFFWVLAARKTNLTTARARENKRSARMLAKTIRFPFLNWAVFRGNELTWNKGRTPMSKNSMSHFHDGLLGSMT